jgi:hypothetical protein
MDTEILKALMSIAQILARIESNQRKILALETRKIGMYEIKTNEEIVKALNKEIEDKGGKG